MPVEIRELQITAIVQNENESASQTNPAIPNSDALVAECVEQVLEILRQKNER